MLLMCIERSVFMYSNYKSCPSVGYQTATVCVPVTVTPYVRAGACVTRCCGGAFVAPGENMCGGEENGSCTFTLSQTLCIAVPVEFGATASVGDASVVCGSASSENICDGCDDIDDD